MALRDESQIMNRYVAPNILSQTCPCDHPIKQSPVLTVHPFHCPVIENFIWIEPLFNISTCLIRPLFSLFQMWPLNTGLTLYWPQLQYLWIVHIHFCIQVSTGWEIHSNCRFLKRINVHSKECLEKHRHLHINIAMGNISTTEGQINARENRRGNQEWTIQKNRQHYVHKTQDEDKQNKKHNT